MYLVASTIVVSVALVKMDKGSKQKLIYLVSKMLTDKKTRCTNFERIALALRIATNKLCPILPSPHYNCPH